MSALSKFPAGATVLLLMMGALFPIVYLLQSAMPGLATVIWTAYIILGVVAGLGAYAHTRKQKKSSNEFDQDLREEAGKAGNLNDPDKIAEQDSLRREFQRGIDIYKQYGKDLYSLPWYVIVGEPGAGKTEAIRNSEIGFPDKLQDRQQGTGGTYSMHWWFTNYAVLLDTAGRLLFEQGAGDKSGWISFLKMLRKNRPDCPINGLLLVLPSTTLAPQPNEEAEARAMLQLEQRAGQIAHQLEVIQSQLEVRFPVYVVVTKTDKIPGFREFFDDLTDARSRYQIMGWSNPDPLDAPFNPHAVDQYLAAIATDFRRRRMVHLKDPTPRNPEVERIDETDSLFALPDSFEALAPKLRRYLEHVFITDQWSAKPPYLRGIYFTSAMQQGAVLDGCIAEALGVPLDALEDHAAAGGGWTRNQAYFLRDLFVEKIFKERGLVTRTGAAGKKTRSKKKVVFATLAAILLFVVAIGFVMSLGVKNAETTLWKEVAQSRGKGTTGQNEYIIPGNQLLSIVGKEKESGEWHYVGRFDIEGRSRPGTKTSRSRLDILKELNEKMKRSPKLGWIYWPALKFDTAKPTETRRTVYELTLKQGILAPLAEATLAKLKDEMKDGAFQSDSADRADALLALAELQIDSEDRSPLSALSSASERKEAEEDLREKIDKNFLAKLFNYTIATRVLPADQQDLGRILFESFGTEGWAPAGVLDASQLKTIEDGITMTLGLDSISPDAVEAIVADLKEFKAILARFHGAEKGDSALERQAGEAALKLKLIAERLEKRPLDSLAAMLASGPRTGSDRAEDSKFLTKIAALFDGRTGNSEFARHLEGIWEEHFDTKPVNDLLRGSKGELVAEFLKKPGGSNYYFRDLVDLFKDCASPVNFELGAMEKDTQVAELSEAIASLEAKLARPDFAKDCGLAHCLLKDAKRKHAITFAENYLFFPLVSEGKAYGQDGVPPLVVSLALLDAVSGPKALQPVIDARKALFHRDGKGVDWNLELGRGAANAMFVTYLQVDSESANVDRERIPRGSTTSMKFVVSDDIKLTVGHVELPRPVAEYDYLGANEPYGIVRLVHDPAVRDKVRHAGTATPNKIVIPLAKNPSISAAAAGGADYFSINITGPTTIPLPDDWPKSAEAVKAALKEAAGP